MRQPLEEIAREIGHGLALDLTRQAPAKEASQANLLDLLLPYLAAEVIRQLVAGTERGSSADQCSPEASQEAEEVEEAESAAVGATEDDDEASGSSFPNLKYAKPKYKDVQSVLKYMEGDSDGRGIKLVIMNFND